ncbi:MAG: aspartate aminotransferase family protein [Anaerolineae bacterium]|nr:MAG: aspartate aminotransferase family protein [Anaerolineae bacterium]
MDTRQIVQAEARYLVHTYNRPPVVFTRGEGSYLFDSEGKRYLDFAAGIAVTALGHAHPAWLEALHEQSRALTHISNLFHSEPQVELARRLVESSFADRVFFSNTGAEANEAALKFSRKWARLNYGEEKTEILAFEGAFHGRTMGALSLTHKAAYRLPFAPLVPGVTFLPFIDLAAAERAISDRVCAVFVEPIQGESGVHVAEAEFLAGLRRLCDKHHVLLVFDEVQCGLGRTGRLWAHEWSGVTPDIMTLAKPLAGGLPIGATLVTEPIASAIEPGDHGSTFAAGPLICSVACVVFDEVGRPDFLQRVETSGEKLRAGLLALGEDRIIELRGRGLLLGVQGRGPVKPLIEAARRGGLIVIGAGEDVLRICPPLTITPEEIEAGLEILADSWNALERADGD